MSAQQNWISHLQSSGVPLTPRPDLQTWLGPPAVMLIFMVCLNIPPLEATSDLYVRAELILLAIYMIGYGWLLLAGLTRPIQLNGVFVASALFSICVV